MEEYFSSNNQYWFKKEAFSIILISMVTLFIKKSSRDSMSEIILGSMIDTWTLQVTHAFKDINALLVGKSVIFWGPLSNQTILGPWAHLFLGTKSLPF